MATSLTISKTLLKVVGLELEGKKISLPGTHSSLVSPLCFNIKCPLACTGAAEGTAKPLGRTVLLQG